jgi:hypothetical protein
MNTHGTRLMSILFALLVGMQLCVYCESIEGTWTPNGAKPAPFSKKYRDKHGIKTPKSYGTEDAPPSNMKMLLFFGGAFGLYFFFSRKNSFAVSATSTRASVGGSNSPRHASRSSSMPAPGLVSPPKSRFATESSSTSSAADEARKARLARFASKEGQERNARAMNAAAKGLSLAPGIAGGANGLRNRGKEQPVNKKIATIGSLNSTNSSNSEDGKGPNTYDGGNSTMYQGRDDDDHK